MEPVIKISQGDSKWDVRYKVWNYMELKDLSNSPRPVHNRIPNFQGAWEACGKLALMEAFAKSAVVKVDPDKPMQGVRLAALQARKMLLVPTPRLRRGLLNRILPPSGASQKELLVCSSSQVNPQGIREFSVPVGLEDTTPVDIVVVGSVAVSEKGHRIGKGEGFADLEHAAMVCTRAVTESTVVLTVVHDCQVIKIPEELIENHDLSVDFIITPTQIIRTSRQHLKPPGIIWSKTMVGIPVPKEEVLLLTVRTPLRSPLFVLRQLLNPLHYLP
ncbi:hypothetical protein DNTS_030404 [Danionella cerebrum]|uniref:Methenyltetrahydrofolate synthase domain-containing protein n=1 Tax=Danionella cerebrum TaxID=2873325 RepID=A0A553RDU9_9TELE|nr:hypothetical protein DNTS_030404 [Danionella translucida]